MAFGEPSLKHFCLNVKVELNFLFLSLVETTKMNLEEERIIVHLWSLSIHIFTGTKHIFKSYRTMLD